MRGGGDSGGEHDPTGEVPGTGGTGGMSGGSGLIARAVACFEERFGRAPVGVARAPGRVNLIGEHIDYNGGFVLPMGIERHVAIAVGAAPAGGRGGTVYSESRGESAAIETSARPGPPSGDPGWADYLRGVAAGFFDRGVELPSFDAAVVSDLPAGGGLSSSAALEVAFATALEALSGRGLDPLDKVLLCQRAEHEFARVPCGLMDQMVSVMARRDHLVLLDCSTHRVEPVPFPAAGVSVLVADTGVRHRLSDGAYGRRRADCEAAARALGVASLRDADPAELEEARHRMTPLALRRARHVLAEMFRPREAAAAIREGRWEAVGELFYASHASLRDDFEVSCPELDRLVKTARQIGPAGGVIGARMTGGGFGGCTVTLVRDEALESVREQLRRGYREGVGKEAAIFASRPAGGARFFTLPLSPR